MTISTEQVKTLREKIGAGVLECRKALVEAEGDEKKALQILQKKGLEVAEKKKERETKQGIIEAYTHCGGKVVGVVELLCETDFVARMDEFKELATNIAQQAAAMAPSSVDELLEQSYIRDPSKTVGDLVTDLVAKVKENIVLVDYYRLEV